MKLKVLLVDDELLIRLGVRSIINWEQYGFQYMGDAADGRKALDMIEKEQPDILLTDIVMPRMNGLQLIEAVKSRYPHIRIIVLSSHNEYNYLRQAMKLGVEDYLLKASMKPEELLEILLDLAERIRASRRELHRQMESRPAAEEMSKARAEWLYKALSGVPDLASAAKEPVSLAFTDQNRLLLMRIHGTNGMASELRPNRTTLYNLVELRLREWGSGYVIPYTDNEWVLLLPDCSPDPDDLERAKLIAHDLISAAKRFLNAPVTLAISRCFADVAHIRQVYEQTKRVLQLYFYEGTGVAYACEEHECPAGNSFGVEREEERLLREALARFDTEGALSTVRSIFERMYRTKSTVDHNIQACLQLLHVIGYEGLGEENPLFRKVLGFERLQEAQEWFERLVREAIERARETMRESHREEIMKLLVYMKSHYTEDLSLKEAARLVNMSENYLSFLFKKEMNVSFTEYLNKLRIEKAAELLLETDMPSYRIAEQVGYENNNYFSRVFKKLKGVSPRAYRSRHLR